MWDKTKDTVRYISQIMRRNPERKKKEYKNKRKYKKTKVKTNPNKPNDASLQKNEQNRRAVKKTTQSSTAIQIKIEALQSGYQGPVCSYCGSYSEIKTAKEYTGKEADYCYWVCPTCDNVSVTTSKNTYKESGDLADAQTRRYRGEVQKLLSDKKRKLNYDPLKLSRWIQQTVEVPKDKAWVGRLNKEQLAILALQSQREVFEDKYGFIFEQVERTKKE